MSSSSVLVLCLSFFLLFSTVTAFNITNILSNQSDFSTYNDALTRTQLAGQINSRQTITVLVVANDQLSSLSGQPLDTVKKILSLHVILDYFDVAKLQKLPNKTTTLTTLYQSTGQSIGQEGFLNATDKDGQVRLGSAVKGSPLSANLVQSVYAQPYNISVLQISSPIILHANSSSNSTTPTSPPSSSPTPSQSPSSPPKSSPTPGKAPSPSKNKAPAPAPASDDSPSGSPADTPSGSPAPAADTPAASPPGMVVGPTAADTPAADSPGGNAAAIAGTGTWLTAVLVIVSSAWGVAKMI